VKYSDVGGASCLCDTRVKYIHKCSVECILILGASCPGIGALNISISVLWNILI
jgi:hypothetical protein